MPVRSGRGSGLGGADSGIGAPSVRTLDDSVNGKERQAFVGRGRWCSCVLLFLNVSIVTYSRAIGVRDADVSRVPLPLSDTCSIAGRGVMTDAHARLLTARDVLVPNRLLGYARVTMLSVHEAGIL